MKTVLIIDDNSELRSILTDFLNGQGYHTISLSKGLDAVEQIGRGISPDIIICDLVIPDLGGKHVVETIRSNPNLKDIPVVIITGSRDPEVYPDEGSYQALLLKPFDLLKLLETVKRLLKSTNV